jgi:ferredoxin
MAPDAFALNDEGKSEAIAEMEDGAADEVIASCPVAAIEE